MAEILRNDGVLSVPTDTVYGVCARMDTVEAQENLRRVKNRPATKAFPIMCADEAQIASICHITSRDHLLIEAFMPGPVTLILKKKEDILPLAKRLLQQVDYSSIHPIRLIGLSVSNATSEEARMEDKENSTQKLEYKELELEFKDWER